MYGQVNGLRALRAEIKTKFGTKLNRLAHGDIYGTQKYLKYAERLLRSGKKHVISKDFRYISNISKNISAA